MEETNDFDMDTDHHSKTSHLHLKYENASGVPIDRKYPLESHATASALAEVIHGLQGRMTLWPNDDNTDMKKKYAALREKQSTSTSVPAAPKPKTAVPPQDSADIVLRVGNDSDDEAGFIQAK